jgi:phage major head subunit gpT-like protein
MITNKGTPRELFTGLSAKYQEGRDSLMAKGIGDHYLQVAEVIPSTTKENVYSWLGNFPAMRRWIGDRQLKSLRQDAYRIVNDKFEATIEVPRDDIEDDQLGQYSVKAKGAGINAMRHPNTMVFDQLKRGLTENCYDGQFFFDTDHPLYNRDNTATTVSNFGGGAGEAWFLLDTMQAMKPLIFQKRRDYQFRALYDLESDHVFMRDSYIMGVDARVATGFGFWQMAYASKQPLNQVNLEAAINAMRNFVDEDGTPLGVSPDLLVVGPNLDFAARQTVNAGLVPVQASVTTSGTNFTGGNTNVTQNMIKILSTPWLRP